MELSWTESTQRGDQGTGCGKARPRWAVAVHRVPGRPCSGESPCRQLCDPVSQEWRWKRWVTKHSCICISFLSDVELIINIVIDLCIFRVRRGGSPNHLPWGHRGQDSGTARLCKCHLANPSSWRQLWRKGKVYANIWVLFQMDSEHTINVSDTEDLLIL